MLLSAVTKKFSHVRVKFHSMIENHTSGGNAAFWLHPLETAENRKNYRGAHLAVT